MKRSFGMNAPETPRAKTKARVAGAVIGLGAVLSLSASMVISYGGSSGVVRTLLLASCALLAAGVVYLILNRRAR